MVWDIAIYALLFSFSTAALLALFGAYRQKSVVSAEFGPLEGYLLAGGSLGRLSVTNLLMSSSFGINAVLYQVWLGYSVGAWGLLAQGAWALSFVLLSNFSGKVQEQKSLHSLIGSQFGASARVVAGIFSIVGLIYFMGWEVNIGKSTLDGLLISNAPDEGVSMSSAASWLTGGIVAGCLLYTTLGGLRGNAFADMVLNVVKLIGFVASIIFILNLYLDNGYSWSIFKGHVFPSYSTMLIQLGLLGLITNIAFSLAWQFVDASAWQNIIGASRGPKGDTKFNLRASGAIVFFAPGILGTILGVLLATNPGLTPDDILVKSVTLFHAADLTALFIVFVFVIACLMSLIDGVLLAVTYAFIVDILHPSKTIQELDSDPKKASRLLGWVRATLLAVALLGAWFVSALLEAFEFSLFSFLYIVIVSQLALIGPVLAALTSRTPLPLVPIISRLPIVGVSIEKRLRNYRSRISPMAVCIILSAGAGFISAFVGGKNGEAVLVDGAGVLTIAVSITLAFAITNRAR